jgi:hypothetical protein
MFNRFKDAVIRGDYNTAREIYYRDPAIINATDDKGWTALHIAANEGSPESIEFLIKDLYVNVDVKTSRAQGYIDWTPLHCAADRQKKDNIKILLKYHANVSLKAEYIGNNPAITRGSRSPIEMAGNIFSDIVREEDRYRDVCEAIRKGRLLAQEEQNGGFLTYYNTTLTVTAASFVAVSGVLYKKYEDPLYSIGALGTGSLVCYGLNTIERIVTSWEESCRAFQDGVRDFINIAGRIENKLNLLFAEAGATLTNIRDTSAEIRNQAQNFDNLIQNTNRRIDLITKELHALVQDGVITLEFIRDNISKFSDETGLTLLTARSAIKNWQIETSLTAEHARRMLDRINIDVQHRVNVKGRCVIS